MVGATVVHRRQDAEHPQARVEDALHVGDRVEQLADPAVAEHLALQRDDHLVGGGQGVEREHAERGRAVQQHHVVGGVDLGQRAAQHVLAARPAHQLRLGAGQLDGRGQQVDAVLGRLDGHRRADPAEQHVVHAELDGLRVQAEGEGQAGLRVEVDQEHLAALLRQGAAQRRHGGRLGDPALLVRHCDGPAHSRHCACPAPRPVTFRPVAFRTMSTPPFLELPAGVRATSLPTPRGELAALSAEPAQETGAPVLLVPGYTGSKEDFIAVLAPIAAAGHRVVALDQRGQFETPGDGDPSSYDVKVLADDVLAVLAGLGRAGAPGRPLVRWAGGPYGGAGRPRRAAVADPDELRAGRDPRIRRTRRSRCSPRPCR